MNITLPKLPYETDSLAPTISAETMKYHYGKHTKTYVENVNNLKIGTEFDCMNLDEIVKSSNGVIFNNAAQAWNHFFYFEALKPNANSRPYGELLMQINADFGSFEEFCSLFEKIGIKHFGSGWVWLTKHPLGKLNIISTPNAETPITTTNIPLLCVDVWEHAYYLDYQNRRAEYLNKIWDIIDWSVIVHRYENT